MQPQGQQMGTEMQQGQTMQHMEMAPQIPSPETQLNMQPVQPENQQIIQNPDAMQAPNMMQNGNMNMAKPQIYENPPEPKQETAAAAPPPPPPGGPNGPMPPDDKNTSFNQSQPAFESTIYNQGNISPTAEKSFDDIESRKAKLQKQLEGYKEELSPDEREIYKKVFG
jgi:hypothetical protein